MIEVTQESVRQKLIKRTERGEKQTYIAKQLGIHRQLLSDFKRGKKVLWDSTLKELDEYLNRTRTLEEIQEGEYGL